MFSLALTTRNPPCLLCIGGGDGFRKDEAIIEYVSSVEGGYSKRFQLAWKVLREFIAIESNGAYDLNNAVFSFDLLIANREFVSSRVPHSQIPDCLATQCECVPFRHIDPPESELANMEML